MLASEYEMEQQIQNQVTNSTKTQIKNTYLLHNAQLSVHCKLLFFPDILQDVKLESTFVMLDMPIRKY